jgi:peptidoglycan/xylan/chitin deacetylase (PgdA/CDA1 family)
MKPRLISAVALLAFCAPSLGAHFDDNYKVYGGDLNGDGLTDVYIKHEARIVLIPIDDGLNIPIVLSETKDLVDEVVLQNNGAGSFTQIAASQLSPSERGIVSTWRTKVGSLKIGDFNHDGAYDAYLDLPPANFIGQVNDVVLFSPVGAGAPIAQAKVDAGFREFFDQIDRWVKNPNYFVDNAPVTTQVVTVMNIMWLPEYCASPAWVAQNGPLENLPPIPTIVAGTLDGIYQQSSSFLQSCAANGLSVVHYDYVSVQYQIPVGSKDYSGFNQAALSLARGALKDAVDAGSIVAGSANAKVIADVIEGVLRTTVFRGGLRDPSVVLEEEQETDDRVNEFRRLRWILGQFQLLAYLSEQGSPDDAGSGGIPVLLTFDDGPAPTSALSVITTALGAQNIKADFYVIGSEVPPNSAQTQALIPLGHKVQNHTWSHPGLRGTTPLPQQTQAQVNQEIGLAQSAITTATGGIAPKRFRAPYGYGGVTGKVDPEIQVAANLYSLTVVYWDVDTEDTKKQQGLNARNIAASVLEAKSFKRATSARPVNILMHVQHSTAKGLPVFIEALKKAGFSFAEPPP